MRRKFVVVRIDNCGFKLYLNHSSEFSEEYSFTLYLDDYDMVLALIEKLKRNDRTYSYGYETRMV